MSAGRIPTTANSPLTTKGDLFTYSTSPARLAVGANGEQIVADSSTATGLKYQAPTVNTVIDAKGDLLAGTAADTVARLAVGANNTVLTADSSTSTGLKWATPAGGGKVLQVVYASYNTDASSTSATYADTGLTATITPTLNTSKVLVLVEQNGLRKEGNTSINLKLFRGSTELLKFLELGGSTATTARNIIGGTGVSYLDSPATTSATTYKTQFAADNGATVYVQNSTSASSITLLEIGA